MVSTFKSGYESISVWAAFLLKGQTPLIRIDGNLNQSKYLKILQDELLPFSEKYHEGKHNMIFQQDGCGPHHAKSVASFLEAEVIELLQWPAQSPDLNPIENAWAILKRNLRRSSTYPTSKDALFDRLSEV